MNPMAGSATYNFFSHTVSNIKEKLTNSEFIALIVDKLQLQLKSSEVTNF